jgi:hypothetical protein
MVIRQDRHVLIEETRVAGSSISAGAVGELDLSAFPDSDWG